LKKQIFALLQLKKTIWKGFIFALPIAVIGFLIYSVLDAVNKLGDQILNPFVPEGRIIWGMGLLVILFLIYILGRIELYSEIKDRKLWRNVKRNTIARVPLLGPFFMSSSKNVISLEELSRMTPCKFWLSETTPHYGFIIREQKVRGAETEIDIYRPNVPNLVPGDLFPLKKRVVIKLGNPSREIINKLASGGLIGSEEEIPVPWEDETEEHFRERINLTPLEIALKRIIGEKFRDIS